MTCRTCGKDPTILQCAIGLVIPNSNDNRNTYKKVRIGEYNCDDCHSKLYGTDDSEFLLVPMSKVRNLGDKLINNITEQE